MIITFISFSFGNVINFIIIIPLIKLINKFRYLFNSYTLDYLAILQNENNTEEELLITKRLGIFSYFIESSIGKRSLKLISQSDNYLDQSLNLNFNKKGILFEGTGLYIDIRFENTSYTNIEDYIEELNLIYIIFHSIAFQFGGEIIGKDLIVWKKDEKEFDFEHMNYCKDICNNNGKVSKLFTYDSHEDNNQKIEINNVEGFRKDCNLAFLAAIEILSNISMKYKNIVNKVIRNNVKVNCCLFKDEFLYGYIGTDILIKDNIFSSIFKQNQRIFSKYIKIILYIN